MQEAKSDHTTDCMKKEIKWDLQHSAYQTRLHKAQRIQQLLVNMVRPKRNCKNNQVN